MSDIQYDPACVDCRRDNGRDLAGTTWQCSRHVLAERNWLRAKLANVMVEWEHDVEVLTKERNAALTLAEQRGAAYDMTWREVESLREWKDKLEEALSRARKTEDGAVREALPEEAEAILHAVAERDCRCGLWIEPVLCESCRARAFLSALSSPPRPETKADDKGGAA